MDISYLSASSLPSTSANAVHVVKMSDAFAALGHRVVLYHAARSAGADAETLLRPFGVEPTFELVGVGRPRIPKIGSLVYGFNVCRALRRRAEPTVLFGRHAASLLCAARMGAPVVYEAHAPPPDAMWAGIERRLFAHPCFAGLVVITSALAEYYQTRMPDRNTAATLVAPDGASVHAGPRAVENAQPFPPPPAGKHRIGYAGGLYEGRGIEVILAVAAAIPEAEVVIVGGNAAQVARWKKGAPENVRWLGHQPHARVASFLESCDVLLAPYQTVVRVAGNKGDTARWMSPLKIFEYMAASRPMVASDLPVLREVLVDGTTAVLVPSDGTGAWIAAVKNLLQSEPLRARLGAEARRQLAARYSWTERAKRIADFVQTRLAAGGMAA